MAQTDCAPHSGLKCPLNGTNRLCSSQQFKVPLQRHNHLSFYSRVWGRVLESEAWGAAHQFSECGTNWSQKRLWSKKRPVLWDYQVNATKKPATLSITLTYFSAGAWGHDHTYVLLFHGVQKVDSSVVGSTIIEKHNETTLKGERRKKAHTCVSAHNRYAEICTNLKHLSISITSIKCAPPPTTTKRKHLLIYWGCTFGGIYVPCIYLNARRDLQ